MSWTKEGINIIMKGMSMDKEIIICLYIIPGIIAALTGVVVAFIELSSRFSDGIERVFRSYGSWIYLLVNAFAAGFIYNLAIIFDIRILNIGVGEHPFIGSFIIGLLSMGLLRSSIFNINIRGHNHEQNIGTVIQKMLKWAEMLYDRDKTFYLLKEVELLVKDIPFEALHDEIIPICMSAFSYLDEEDNDKIHDVMSQLRSRDDNITEKAKVSSLSLQVAKIVGIKILKQGIENYNKDKKNNIEENIKKRMMLLQKQKEKIITNISSQEDKR